MTGQLTTIAFDADDTLWHTETYFRLTQERFAALLADYTDPDTLMERLLAAEHRNLGHYGYGIKGFTLSMIETALDVTGGRVPGPVIRELLEAGREMLRHPVDLLPHAHQTLHALSARFRLLLVTKGDLLDQERKVMQSGLAELFAAVEIVSEKTPQVYADIFARHGDGAARAMMVGNSMRSDILPALDSGAWAVFVPSDITWAVEHAPPPVGARRFWTMDNLAQLPGIVEKLS